jgi:prolipoprotein diacylglyceryl transferase
VIGARLGHCLFYEPAYYLRRPLEILMIWRGGLASHGGAVGIFLALYGYSRRRPDQPYLWLLDRMAIPTALGGSFIRLGNLFNSEILGISTDVPWAFVFARIDDLPRHPAQLYESLAYLLIFGVLFAVYRKRGSHTPRGLLLGLFLVLVFGARFVIECVKVRQAAFGEALPLSMGQLLSIPAILVGVVLLVRVGLRGNEDHG